MVMLIGGEYGVYVTGTVSHFTDACPNIPLPFISGHFTRPTVLEYLGVELPTTTMPTIIN
jgi:hypothetical protein